MKQLSDIPMADMADHYSHNTKLYNPCYIKKVGLDFWIVEEDRQIQKNILQVNLLWEKVKQIRKQQHRIAL